MSDILYQAAEFYSNNLENRKFKLVAGRKGKTIELNIFFGAEHFKHLAGLHKLEDLPISIRESTIIYREILDKKTTISDIIKSRFYSETDGRLKNFHKIKAVLFSKNLMIKSLKGYFFGITADYLLSQNEERTQYVHLFLKSDKGIVVPVTFFVRNDDRYIRNNERWTVLSVEEIKKGAKPKG